MLVPDRKKERQLSGPIDVDKYVALLHSSPPGVLAARLSEILGDPPVQLPYLQIFVPEVCSMLGTRIAAGDAEGASELGEALRSVLTEKLPELDGFETIGWNLPKKEACAWAYLLGRLQSSIVLAIQLPHIDKPPFAQVEALDGGDNQAILYLLSRKGPMAIKTLRMALNDCLDGPQRRLEELRKNLGRLIRVKAVDVDVQTRHGNLYRISPLGQRMLDDSPPWLEMVTQAYRAYRMDLACEHLPFGEQLKQIFLDVDGESNED